MPSQPPARTRLAVIIPYYNGSKTIERAVASVLTQTVPADELIVVNDGSTQPEAEFLHALAGRLGFRVIDQENGGQGAARNAGVAACAADYVCFLDQDDFFLKNHNELLLAAIPGDDPHFGWAYADLFEADGDGNIVRHSMVSGLENPKTDIFRMLKRNLYILPSAAIIRRAAFDAVGGFDSQFTGYEDDDLFLRLFRKGFTNYYLDRAVTVWCIHGDSTSYSVGMMRSSVRYFNKLIGEFHDEPQLGRFYFRDGIYQRFRRQFVASGYNAVKRGALYEHYPEILENLKKFIEVSAANGTVSGVQLALVRLQYLLLSTRLRFLIVAFGNCYKTITQLIAQIRPEKRFPN